MNDGSEREKIKPLGFFQAHGIVQSNKHRINKWEYYGKSVLAALLVDIIIGPIFVFLAMYFIGGIASVDPSVWTFSLATAFCLLVWAVAGCVIYHLFNVRLIRDHNLLEPEPTVSGVDFPKM